MISAVPLRVLCLALILIGVACVPPEGGNDAGCTADCEPVDSGTITPRPITDPVDTTNHSLADAGSVDAGVINAFPALTDYYRCNVDTDCPIGLGECIKSVPFNRADAVLGSTVTIASLDLRLNEGQGVCTRVCTSDETVCDTLALRDANGDQRTFTCQVIAVGGAPYPAPAPAFPFSDQLNPGELAAGQPFAAICRPPFELHNDVSDDTCGACDSTQACSGICFDFATGAARQPDAGAGTCLALTVDGGCPFGFASRTLDAGTSFCAPLQDTALCGACIDRDEDFFGTGHCTRSSYDCDDRNAAAYFSSSSPAHPFPNFCGQFDYNCNGLADDSEQVGIATYLANHCEYCGDDKHGQTVNAGTSSQAVLACVNGVMQTQSCATPGRIHCAGDVRTTGCEASAVDGGVTWYADDDGDGYGDPTQTSLGCPGGGAPSGYVSVSGDCNDTNPAVHPNQRDTCDCWGTCAATGARVDNDCDGQTDEDVIAYKWYADVDLDGAPGAVSNSGATFCGSPGTGLVPQLPNVSVTADCSDTDNTRYNASWRVTDSTYAAISLPLNAAPPRDATGNLYLLYTGAATEVCDSRDNDCNGVVDNGVQTVFYRDADNDSWGLAGTTATSACAPPTGYVARSGDCNDTSVSIYPGATEQCDGVDQDCNGVADNNVTVGGSCTTSSQGICAAGVTTACTNGAFVCTSSRVAQTFDDPSTNTDSDEDCDGAERVVYVDSTGSDSNSGLVANLPVQTIARGIALAALNSRTQVWIASGSYTSSALITLSNGIDLVGGFSRVGTSYTWNGGATLIIQDGTVNSSGKAIAIHAQSLTRPTTLAHLAIQVRDPTATSVTTVGINLNSCGSNLQLRDVNINVAAGTAGAAATDGIAGTNGVRGSGSTGGTLLCRGQNVSGGNGGTGSGGAGYGDFPGALTPSGAGDDGVTSTATVAGGTNTANNYFPLTASNGNSGATGFHGSGGSASAAFSSITKFNGAGGSSGGCGGTGGEGGRFGGSSLGILMFNSGLTVGSSLAQDKVSITTNGGGAGSNGGTGGNGGNGAIFNVFSPNPYPSGSGSGGRPGGGGAGGYGGWNVPIATFGSPQSTYDWCTNGGYDATKLDLFTNGTAGAGGAGGASGTGGLVGTGSGRALSSNSGAAGVAGTSAFCVWKPI